MAIQAGNGREFFHERDVRIFQMKRNGVSTAEIAKRFDMSPAQVSAAVRRQLERLDREAAEALPYVKRMELERLDALLASVWPLTQFRTVTLPDGTQTVVEPDVRFIQQALAIGKDRQKLLGLDKIEVNVNTGTAEDSEKIKSTLAGAEKAIEANTFDPKQETLALLELMTKSRIFPPSIMEQIIPTLELTAAPIAEIVEADEVHSDTEAS